MVWSLGGRSLAMLFMVRVVSFGILRRKSFYLLQLWGAANGPSVCEAANALLCVVVAPFLPHFVSDYGGPSRIPVLT